MSRTFEYDTLFQTYPVKETMHLGGNKSPLSMQAEYDLTLGKITQVTDFNEQVSYYTYDSFGRPVDVIQPGDSFAYPGQTYSYRMADPHRGMFYNYGQDGSLLISYGSDTLMNRISTPAREILLMILYGILLTQRRLSFADYYFQGTFADHSDYHQSLFAGWKSAGFFDLFWRDLLRLVYKHCNQRQSRSTRK